MSFTKYTLIGSGNLAFHLAKQMIKCGVPLVEVVSRPSKSLNYFKKKIDIPVCVDFSEMQKHKGLYIIAVTDDSIPDVIKKIPKSILSSATIAHTSGATHSKVLKKHAKKFAVLWPVQSFSKKRRVGFSHLPFLTTSSDKNLEKKLSTFCGQLGSQTLEVNDMDRMRYHCAAVFVNNFTNHLFTEASELLDKKDLPFDVLQPLIKETVNKAFALGPKSAQTGPAKRGDKKTMAMHEDIMKEKELIEVYELLSKRIRSAHS